MRSAIAYAFVKKHDDPEATIKKYESLKNDCTLPQGLHTLPHTGSTLWISEDDSPCWKKFKTNFLCSTAVINITEYFKTRIFQFTLQYLNGTWF